MEYALCVSGLSLDRLGERAPCHVIPGTPRRPAPPYLHISGSTSIRTSTRLGPDRRFWLEMVICRPNPTARDLSLKKFAFGLMTGPAIHVECKVRAVFDQQFETRRSRRVAEPELDRRHRPEIAHRPVGRAVTAGPAPVERRRRGAGAIYVGERGIARPVDAEPAAQVIVAGNHSPGNQQQPRRHRQVRLAGHSAYRDVRDRHQSFFRRTRAYSSTKCIRVLSSLGLSQCSVCGCRKSRHAAKSGSSIFAKNV